MIKIHIYIPIIIISLFIIGACDRTKPIIEEIPHIPKEKNEVFQLEWSTRIDYEEEIVGADQQYVYNNKFLCFGDLGAPPTIIEYDTETGDLINSKSIDYLKTNIDQVVQYRNILICRNAFHVFGFNLDTDEVEWIKDFTDDDERLGRGTIAENGMYYFLTDEDFKGFNHTQHIYEFDPLTGENRVVYSERRGDEGLSGTSPPAYYSNGKEEFLLFNEFPNHDAPPERSTQNLVALNLETLDITWRVEDFTEYFASNSLHPPVIYEDIVITGGDWSIYAFDINSGEQLWRYEETNTYKLASWSTTNHLVYKDKLYVNETGYNVTCLDPRTGTVIWNNPKGGPNCTDNMVYYEKEDLLVFTSWGNGSVMILDALTGETLHREHRYDNSSYNNDVAYDPKTDMFFTSTYKHAVGFKIQRP